MSTALLKTGSMGKKHSNLEFPQKETGLSENSTPGFLPMDYSHCSQLTDKYHIFRQTQVVNLSF